MPGSEQPALRSHTTEQCYGTTLWSNLNKQYHQGPKLMVHGWIIKILDV